MSKLVAFALFAAQMVTIFSCADAYGQYLYAKEFLMNGDMIRYFPYGYVRYDLTMQTNCDFVFNHPYGPVWSSETGDKGTAGSCYVTMQEDCNLVVYPDSNSGPGYGLPALWATGTNGAGQGCYLWIGQWDSVIQGIVFDSSSKALWSTNSQ